MKTRTKTKKMKTTNNVGNHKNMDEKKAWHGNGEEAEREIGRHILFGKQPKQIPRIHNLCF